MTGLSVAICFFIGAIEVLGLLPHELHLKGSFWRMMAGFDINKAGMIIVAMFVVTWAGAVLFWRYGHVEEKWSSGLRATEITVLETADHSPDVDDPRGEIAGPSYGFAAD
jgi:high-affinity nickel-transport protein